MDTRFALGFLHLWRRELDDAEEYLRAALQLAETCGAAWIRTLSLTYLTALHRLQGRQDGVSSHALRALEAAEAAAMPDYVAAARANQVWLAWCRGDLAATELLCQEALAQWRQSPLVYPFQWQVLWPLLAVALARGREDEACSYAEALLEPTQQRLPDPLNVALAASIADLSPKARAQLERAVAIAQELGYL